jgi:hypothetical protein
MSVIFSTVLRLQSLLLQARGAGMAVTVRGVVHCNHLFTVEQRAGKVHSPFFILRPQLMQFPAMPNMTSMSASWVPNWSDFFLSSRRTKKRSSGHRKP